MAPYRHYSWLGLVQVCRRWRYLVFTSPRRLGLRFLCRATKSVREILDVWSTMQIIIPDLQLTCLYGDHNIIAALEHRDRVCEIDLSRLTSSLLERLATMMQEPFPVLTKLDLHYSSYHGHTPPVLPDTFLGGFAPRLQSLHLSGIPFPTLPKLLLSARDLVSLRLINVPHTGYISPEAMVTCLSTLTKLESLTLAFQSPSSCPYQGGQRPPPLTRIVLPVLTKLDFQGVGDYLEDLLSRMDTPVIRGIETTFFHQDIIFDTRHLLESISRTATLEPLRHARLHYYNGIGRIDLHSVCRNYGNPSLSIGVLCDEFNWQVSFLVHICNQFLPLLSSVESLYIQYDRQDDIYHAQWLEIFRPFIALQSLHIEPRVVPLIAFALQELTGDRVMEVLPALHSIYLTLDPPRSARKALDQFTDARQLSGHPLTVQCPAVDTRVKTAVVRRALLLRSE